MDKKHIISLAGMFIAIFFINRIGKNSHADDIYNYAGIALGLLLIAYAWYTKLRK